MSELHPVTLRQTIDILARSPVMPDDVIARITQSRPRPDHPDEPTPPLVIPEAFSTALDELIAEKGPDGPQRNVSHSRWATYDQVVALGRTSVLMAYMLGGDIVIPRPRVLHEHTQSELNVHSEYLADLFTDPRDRVMPVAHFMKDIGKSYAVAIHPERSSREQGIHNQWIARRLLRDST